ncbi:MAG: hypothetical protein JJV95_02945 [Sulfurospirillum sp.]|nr:hypothetical protein [Sulfurospirillum sp.]
MSIALTQFSKLRLPKFIIESGTKGSFFKELKEAGWHTSYYMPTGKMFQSL